MAAGSTQSSESDAPRSFVNDFTSDLNNVNKFANASSLGDKDGMIEAFNNFSWSDNRVLEHLPKYCESSSGDRKYIDHVFSVLCPTADKVQGPCFNTMRLWLKARLHLQHQNVPFQYKPKE